MHGGDPEATAGQESTAQKPQSVGASTSVRCLDCAEEFQPLLEFSFGSDFFFPPLEEQLLPIWSCFKILSGGGTVPLSSLCHSSSLVAFLLSSVESTSCSLLIRVMCTAGLALVLPSPHISSQRGLSATQMCMKMCIRKAASWAYLEMSLICTNPIGTGDFFPPPLKTHNKRMLIAT